MTKVQRAILLSDGSQEVWNNGSPGGVGQAKYVPLPGDASPPHGGRRLSAAIEQAQNTLIRQQRESKDDVTWTSPQHRTNGTTTGNRSNSSSSNSIINMGNVNGNSDDDDDDYDELADPELVRIRQGVKQLERTGTYPSNDVAHTYSHYVASWEAHPTVDVGRSLSGGVRVPTREEERQLISAPGFVQRAVRKKQEDEWLTLSARKPKDDQLWKSFSCFSVFDELMIEKERSLVHMCAYSTNNMVPVYKQINKKYKIIIDIVS